MAVKESIPTPSRSSTFLLAALAALLYNRSSSPQSLQQRGNVQDVKDGQGENWGLHFKFPVSVGSSLRLPFRAFKALHITLQQHFKSSLLEGSTKAMEDRKE